MGRPGAGGGRSSSGHGAGRSSSGHRPGGDRRPGAGSGGFGGFGSGNFGGPSFGGPSFGGPSFGGPPPRRHGSGADMLGGFLGGLIGSAIGNATSNHNNQPRYAQPTAPVPPPNAMPPQQPPYQPAPNNGPSHHQRNGHVAAIFGVIAVVVVLVIFWAALSPSSSSSSVATDGIPASTVNREKLNTGITYDTNCVQDQLGWITNVSQVESQLRTFYNDTGIQPYVVLKSYDASLKTDGAKQSYAEEWYDHNIANESTLLFMYFAEQDADNDVGYMALVNGKQIGTVMDSQAVDIFWAYMDQYWYSNMSTGEVITKTFDNTGARIMKHTTTTQDVLKYVVIGVIIVAVGVIIIVLVRQKHRRDKEKAEETERILNTPLDYSDPLLNKYETQSNQRAGDNVDNHSGGSSTDPSYRA